MYSSNKKLTQIDLHKNMNNIQSLITLYVAKRTLSILRGPGHDQAEKSTVGCCVERFY